MNSLNALIPVVLSLIQQTLPLIAGSNPAIAKVVETIVAITPIVVQEVQDLTPIVKNIITALKADPATAADQLAQLRLAEVALDANFDAAAAAALAEDTADQTKPT